MNKLLLICVFLFSFLALKAQSPEEVFYHYEYFIFTDTAFIPKISKVGNLVKLTFKEDTLTKLAAQYQFNYFYTRDSLKLKNFKNYNARLYLSNIYYNFCVNDSSFVRQWKELLHHISGNPKPFYDKAPLAIPHITSIEKQNFDIWLEEPWPSDTIKGYQICISTKVYANGFIYTSYDKKTNNILLGDLISTSFKQVLVQSRASARIDITEHQPKEVYTLFYKGDTLQFRVSMTKKKFNIEVLKRIGNKLNLQNENFNRLQKRDVLIYAHGNRAGIYDTILVSKLPAIIKRFNLKLVNDNPHCILKGLKQSQGKYFIYKKPFFYSKRKLMQLDTKLKSLAKKEPIYLGWYPEYFSRY